MATSSPSHNITTLVSWETVPFVHKKGKSRLKDMFLTQKAVIDIENIILNDSVDLVRMHIDIKSSEIMTFEKVSMKKR